MLSHRLKQYIKDHLQDDQFSPIHLNYKGIKVIDHIPNRFAYVQELYLNHNQLYTLSGIESFTNLKIFHVRFNNLCDLNELKRIKNPFFLQSLATLGNPFESDPNCKHKWLKQHLFRNLKEYNPSSAAYYRERDKSPAMVLQEPKRSTKLTPPQVRKTPYHQTTQRKDNRNVDLSVSFIGRRGTTTPGTSGQNQQRAKEVSFEMQTNVPKLEQTERYPKSSFWNSSIHHSDRKPARHQAKIRPFDHQDPQQQLVQPSAQTAKFSFKGRKPTIRKNLTSKFVQQQLEYLADSFYYRNLYEKAMNALSSAQSQQPRRFYEAQLTLKAFTALKTNRMLCGIERDFSEKKMELLNISLEKMRE